MTLPVRPLKLTYAGNAFGNGTSVVINAISQPMNYSKDDEKFRFGCDLVVSEADTTTFATTTALVETTFAAGNRNKAFLLEMVLTEGHQTIETFDPATNTGFNAVPSLTKPGSPLDGPLSRLYRISVEIDLPYTETGKAGRTGTAWEISFSDSRRRRLLVSSKYTALAGNQAYANYIASEPAIATAIQTAIGGSWEGPLNEQVKGDLNYTPSGSGDNQVGKILTFSREYQENIFPETLAGLLDVRLRRQKLVIEHAKVGPGDYAPGNGGVFRLMTLSVDYAVAVDKTQTTDLASVYTTLVKPLLKSQAQVTAGAASVCITSAVPRYDWAENAIGVRMTLVAAGAGNVIRSSVKTLDEFDPGEELIGVWDGRKRSKERFDNPGSLRRTVTWDYEVLGAGGAGGVAGGGGGAGPAGFALGALNQPLAFQITEANGVEAGIDNFFGISAGFAVGGGAGGVGGGDGAEIGIGDLTSTAGAKLPPGASDSEAVFLFGSILIEPINQGVQGEGATLASIHYAKTKTWEFIRTPEEKTPSGGDGVTRTASPGGGFRNGNFQ